MDIDPSSPPPPTKKTEENTDTDKSKDEKTALDTAAPAEYPNMSLAQDIHKLTQLYAPVAAATTTATTTSTNNSMETVDDKSVVAATMGISDLDTFITSIMTELTKMENPSLQSHIQSMISLPSTHTHYKTSDELDKIRTSNTSKISELEQFVQHQKENAGDMEVLDSRIDVARFVTKTGTLEEALDKYEQILDLPKLSSGKRMDALMECTRICSFYGDVSKNEQFLERISKLADQSGDWDRRNRLKVYQSLLSYIPKRQMKEASKLLLDCIATFSCNEICTYTEFIQYTMLMNILHLPRTELKKKILDGPEILTVTSKIPHVTSLVSSYYECNYQDYLEAIVNIAPILTSDRYLAPHAGYLLREYHVLGYQQFLDAYKSVTLESMAQSFGVSVEYLDIQLSRFIAAGRLTAKIDKFGGVVETRRPDRKNKEYRECIQKGDLLLNRIQKLARVVDL